MYQPKTKLLLVMLIVVTIFSSCSKDDDGDESSNGLDGVPSGEIVAKNLRNITLTGFNELSRNEGSQKWWRFNVVSEMWNGNCDEDDYIGEGFGYLALYPNGESWQKNSIGGEPYFAQNWQWSNGNKTALYLNGETDIAFTITYLNDDNVVYGYNISAGGCSLTYYEQYGNTVFD